MKHFLLALFSLPVFAAGEGGLPTQPYIYVEGEAVVERPADMVTLKFELSAQNPDQAVANQTVQEKAAKVFALLKKAGIADNEIIAVDLSMEAEYEESEDAGRARGRFTGYKASRPFAVKVRDLARFPKLVDELIALPVEEFSSIEEGFSEPKKLEDEVWEKALTNAKNRAEKTLAAAGSKLGSLFAISPVSFPQITRRIFEGGGETYASQKSVEPDKITSDNYRLRPISVKQSVHVIYLIQPAAESAK